MSNVPRRIFKPELVYVNDKPISSHGKFNPGMIADYLIEHGRAEWISVGKLANIAYHQNVPSSRDRTRKALSRLFWDLFGRGELLIYDYEEHNRIRAVKICDVQLAEDWERAEERVQRMKKRKELTLEQYEKAQRLLEIHYSILD